MVAPVVCWDSTDIIQGQDGGSLDQESSGKRGEKSSCSGDILEVKNISFLLSFLFFYSFPLFFSFLSSLALPFLPISSPLFFSFLFFPKKGKVLPAVPHLNESGMSVETWLLCVFLSMDFESLCGGSRGEHNCQIPLTEEWSSSVEEGCPP